MAVGDLSVRTFQGDFSASRSYVSWTLKVFIELPGDPTPVEYNDNVPAARRCLHGRGVRIRFHSRNPVFLCGYPLPPSDRPWELLDDTPNVGLLISRSRNDETGVNAVHGALLVYDGQLSGSDINRIAATSDDVIVIDGIDLTDERWTPIDRCGGVTS